MSAATETLEELYARLNARVARGECYWCGEPGGADYCRACAELLPICPDCHERIEGCVWNGRCIECHQAALLPETAWDRWNDAYSD